MLRRIKGREEERDTNTTRNDNGREGARARARAREERRGGGEQGREKDGYVRSTDGAAQVHISELTRIADRRENITIIPRSRQALRRAPIFSLGFSRSLSLSFSALRVRAYVCPFLFLSCAAVSPDAALSSVVLVRWWLLGRDLNEEAARASPTAPVT